MVDIYFMAKEPQLLLLLCICLFLIVQSAIFTMAFNVRTPHRNPIIMQEAIILSYIFILALSLSTPIACSLHGSLNLLEFSVGRYLIGCLTLATVFLRIQGTPASICLIITVLLTLPWADRYSSWLLILALTSWALRIFFIVEQIKEFRHKKITRDIVKEAIDKLPIGMIFAKENGEIFLANVAALKYMYGCFYHYYEDINALWKDSQDYRSIYSLSNDILGRDLLLRVSPTCSLLVSLDVLQTPGKKILQMLIRDVTKEDLGNAQLLKQNEALSEASNKLKNILNNLEVITQEQVTAKLHFYIHDLMGQKITILQQYLNEGAALDYKKLLPILDEFLEDMRHTPVQKPQDKLANIVATYANIGITIELSGLLPPDSSIAETFVAIIREGVTNAVRHGHCNQVSITLAASDATYSLDIEDNGIGCTKTVVEGTGLQGIKRRIEEINGILVVTAMPHFKLHCEVMKSHD